MNKLKVVVIGTGVGGAGTAALLQHYGCDVTLLDKNEYIGGRCHTFEKDGFMVDSGIHMFSRGPKGPLGEINKAVDGNLEWITRRSTIMFFMRKGRYRMPYCQPVYDPEMIAKLGLIAGREMTRMAKGRFSTSSEKRVKFMNNTLFKVLRREGGIPGLIKEVLKILGTNKIYLEDLDDMTLRDFLFGFTENELIHQVLAYVGMILTSIPYTQVSTGELLWCVIKQIYAASFGLPVGASRAIPAAYIEAMQRDGGELKLGTQVEGILQNGGRVTGVRTKDGEITADVVVSNAGILLTTRLIGEDNLPAEYVKRAKELKTSYSHITRKYLLSKKAVVLPRTFGIFNVPEMDPETMFDYTDNGTVPEDAYMFTSVPTEVDHHLGKPDKQLVIMGMPGPRSGSADTDDHCGRILDKGEEKIFGYFPEMEKSVEWMIQTNSRYYSAMTGKPTGDSIGIGQIPGQVGRNRPPVTTPVKGLFLVGGDVGGRGIGTELAAAGALMVSKLVMTKQKSLISD